MADKKTLFYDAEDVQELLGISRSKAYKIIRTLNAELLDAGYIVIPGKVPKKYFAKRYYGGIGDNDISVAV